MAEVTTPAPALPIGQIVPDPGLLRQWRARAISEQLSGGENGSQSTSCGLLPENIVLVKSRCGHDRDCVSDDRLNPFFVAWCNALAWCSLGQGRYVEIWNQEGTFRLLKVTERAVTNARVGKCQASGHWGDYDAPGSQSGADPFTVNIPGLSDIVRLPGIETAQTRRERAARARASHSALPEGLRWVPKLLNKLDDAQDLLFTAVALAVPLMRFLGLRFLPGVGVALTVNDLLNGFT